jgi:hypothetical protein
MTNLTALVLYLTQIEYTQPLHQLIKTNINNMIYQHQLIVNLYVHNLFHLRDQYKGLVGQ